jgi:GNAT superfamily N-acetyltransferase
MRIVPFEPGMAAGVAQCYSEMAAPAPYCEPVGGEWFAELRKLRRQPLAEEALLVAREGTVSVGFVHVGTAAPATEGWHTAGEPGVIRFLTYRRAERAVGAALLEAAEDWLRGRGCRQVVAGHCNFLYPFYHLPFGHISERISHLPPLFGMAGYGVSDSEVFFAWEDFQAPEVDRPNLPVEVVGGWQEAVASFGPGVALRLVQGERRVGECDVVALGSDDWRPALKDWCFCTSLDIDGAFQGKGLGKHLLARGLREARRHGLRHAMISTDWDNHRACLFYTNFGYGFLDRTFAFRKEISG